MLLVQIFNYELDTGWLIFMLTIAGTLAWWLIKLNFKQKDLKSEIQSNRLHNQDAINTLQNEIAKKDKANEDRYNEYKLHIQEIKLLIDNHSKNDEEKFSHILTQLGNISEKMAVISNNMNFIIEGKFKP